ncbi:MAG: carbohydrate-binding protein [Eubacteriales bacterium]|nr:carbohydrate-binding protein [Eubacteriales bacterium]
MSKLQIIRGQEILAQNSGAGEVQLLFTGSYQPGDRIVFEAKQEHCVVQVDQSLTPARVFLPDRRMEYRLPLSGDNLAVYPPHAFAGEKHLLSLKPDNGNEYRNLALNPADQRGEVTAYPHATANVETRDESVFCARNVIDGLHIANGHGEWPYQSWGIGARTDAEITLNFGREVEIDAMALYLRADFPHDAYWIEGTAELSDGFTTTFPLQQLNGAQQIQLGKHRVQWIKLHHMIKCDMPSAFPALRQWEVYGTDVYPNT